MKSRQSQAHIYKYGRASPHVAESGPSGPIAPTCRGFSDRPTVAIFYIGDDTGSQGLLLPGLTEAVIAETRNEDAPRVGRQAIAQEGADRLGHGRRHHRDARVRDRHSCGSASFAGALPVERGVTRQDKRAQAHVGPHRRVGFGDEIARIGISLRPFNGQETSGAIAEQRGLNHARQCVGRDGADRLARHERAFTRKSVFLGMTVRRLAVSASNETASRIWVSADWPRPVMASTKASAFARIQDASRRPGAGTRACRAALCGLR